MKPISFGFAVFIWVYDVFFFIVQDLLKILMIAGFESYYSIKIKDKDFFPPVLTDTFSQVKEGERRKTIVTQRSYLAANESVKRSFKIVFLGDSSVGKTSFIRRICRNKFEDQLSATGTCIIDFFILVIL